MKKFLISAMVALALVATPIVASAQNSFDVNTEEVAIAGILLGAIIFILLSNDKKDLPASP